MGASTYNLKQIVARSSHCEFHSQPRNGDAGICSRRVWKAQRGPIHEVARQERRVAATAVVDSVHPQKDPSGAESSSCSAHRGSTAGNPFATIEQSAAAGGGQYRSAARAGNHAAVCASEEGVEAQETGK